MVHYDQVNVSWNRVTLGLKLHKMLQISEVGIVLILSEYVI